MTQTNINIRMDETLKNNFDYVCNELGMTMSTAITIFAKKMCREKRIPFEVSIDPKYESEERKMSTNTKFKVSVFPEYNPNGDIDPFETKFVDFREAFDYLIEKNREMEEIICSSHDFDVSKGRPCWSFEILDRESMHKRMYVFGDEGLQFVCDDKYTDITPDCDDELDIFGVLFGHLKSLNVIN